MEAQSPTFFHVVFGVLTLIFALTVIMSRNPVVSAMALVATLFTTGTLFFGMGFYFIGAVQILIYAGAISVLFVFIVMLLDMRPPFSESPGRGIGNAFAVGAGLLLLGALAITVIRPTIQDNASSVAVTENAAKSLEARAIALQFLSKYIFPFELTGLLILAAVMGVVILGRPKKIRNSKGSAV